MTAVFGLLQHTHTRERLEQEEQEEPSLQRAPQLDTNCLALTSRTFLRTNEAGGGRRGRRGACLSGTR